MEEVAGLSGPGLRRAVLIGPESTGKTTLAAALAAHYATTWSPEYARQYMDAKHAPLTYADVEPIARGQIAAEDAAAPTAKRVFILDTDLVSTAVNSQHYYGSVPEWVRRAAAERQADLYLLHHPDVPWVADGAQRDGPGSTGELLALFRETLASLQARVVDIQGSWPDRWQRAVTAIDALL